MSNKLPNHIKNISEYPNSFKRQGRFPLDVFSVFQSTQDALDYINDNRVAYAGQNIAIYDADEPRANIYTIQPKLDDDAVVEEDLKFVTTSLLTGALEVEANAVMGAGVTVAGDLTVSGAASLSSASVTGDLQAGNIIADSLTVGNMVGEGSDYVQLPKLKVAGDIIAAGDDTNNSINGDAFIHGNNNTVGARGYYIAAVQPIVPDEPVVTQYKCEFYLSKIQASLDNSTLDSETGIPSSSLLTTYDYLPTISTPFGDEIDIVFGKRFWNCTVDAVGGVGIGDGPDEKYIDFVRVIVPHDLYNLITNPTTFESFSDYTNPGTLLPKDEFSVFKRNDPNWNANLEIDSMKSVPLKEQGNAFGYGNSSVGNYSTTFGLRNKAYGEYALVQGRDSSGTYNNAIFGSSCHGTADSCFVQGFENTANGDISFIAGRGNTNDGNYGTVLGYGNLNTGLAGFVAGRGNSSEASYGLVSGSYNTVRGGNGPMAVGNGNILLGTSSFIGGGSTKAYHGQDGLQAIADAWETNSQNAIKTTYESAAQKFNVICGGFTFNYGKDNAALSDYSAIFGSNNKTYYGNNVLIAGENNTSSGSNTHYSAIFGQNNINYGLKAFIVGEGQTVKLSHAVGVGLNNFSYGNCSFIGGSSTSTSEDIRNNLGGLDVAAATNESTYTTGKTWVTKYYSKGFAQDNTNTRAFNVVAGHNSFVFGKDNGAIGNCSVALGEKNYINNTSHAAAIGYNNTVSGQYSAAIGCENEVSGEYTTAFGYSNNATKKAAVALGYDNTASGQYTFAGGSTSTSSANYSFAFGYKCEAGKEGSVAFGEQTITNKAKQFVVGRFNAKDADALFIVGDGESGNTRKNLFVVKPSSADFAGGINVTGATTTATLKVNAEAGIGGVLTVGDDIILKGKLLAEDGTDLLATAGGGNNETSCNCPEINTTGASIGAIPIWNGTKFVTTNIKIDPVFN